jgi:prevent-host-death family protein
MVLGGEMAVWQIAEAGTWLGEVMEEAVRNGAQIISEHGVEKAVVLSIEDYRALTTLKADLLAQLLGGPKVDDFVIPRSRNSGRKVSL